MSIQCRWKARKTRRCLGLVVAVGAEGEEAAGAVEDAEDVEVVEEVVGVVEAVGEEGAGVFMMGSEGNIQLAGQCRL